MQIQQSTPNQPSGTNLEPVVYENKNYKVIVGIPASSSDFPNPTPAYLIVNKIWGVIEYFDSRLHMVKEFADYLNDRVEGKPIDEKAKSENPNADLFN